MSKINWSLLWDRLMIIMFTTGLGLMMFEILCLIALAFMYLF